MNLCRKNVIENWKTNLLRIGLMYGVMAVIFVWAGYSDYKNLRPEEPDPFVNTTLGIFAWFGLICGCISASFTMENMKSKTSRLSSLMIPATPFEKYFSRWFVSTIVFIVVFIIAYLLADYTRVLIYSFAYPDKNIVAAQLSYFFSSEASYGFPDASDAIGRIILCYLFLQSCFVLGSSIWPKNSLVKTFVAAFAVLLLNGIILGGFLYFFFNDSNITFNKIPLVSEEIYKALLYVVPVFFILLNWTLAYFRFKEAEIINRL